MYILYTWINVIGDYTYVQILVWEQRLIRHSGIHVCRTVQLGRHAHRLSSQSCCCHWGPRKHTWYLYSMNVTHCLQEGMYLVHSEVSSCKYPESLHIIHYSEQTALNVAWNFGMAEDDECAILQMQEETTTVLSTAHSQSKLAFCNRPIFANTLCHIWHWTLKWQKTFWNV